MIALATTVRRAVLLLFAACSGLSRAGNQELVDVTSGLPDVPAPPQGDVWWISKSMRMNGLPMTLKNFRSRLTPDAVCDYYRLNVPTHAPGEILRSRNGDWSMLSIRSRRELVTVQVRATRLGSEGTITVSPPPETVRLKVETTFPRPLSATIVNLQEYDDAGMEAEHITLSSVRSVGVEAHAFVDRLTRNGWQITLREPMQSVSRGQLVEAQKGAQHAMLSLAPDKLRPGTTSIVIIWKKS
jgi:hypothetical protein